MKAMDAKYMELRAEAAKESEKRFNKVCWVILAITCLAAAAVGVTSNLGKKK